MDHQYTSSGSGDVASEGRERVFCHNCENEWFRDSGGLVCPRCNSDITEIVSFFFLTSFFFCPPTQQLAAARIKEI